ncbi:MAG TPA: hypothetical protein VF895_05980 [Gaiellaceae bacterium]
MRVEASPGTSLGAIAYPSVVYEGSSISFLFSRNRLNVAISRAKALAVLVASPKLLEIRCRTIEDMRLVNALCRFVELAGI